MNTFIIIMKIGGLIFITRTRKGDRKHKEGGYVRLQEIFSVHVRGEEEQWWVRAHRNIPCSFPQGLRAQSSRIPRVCIFKCSLQLHPCIYLIQTW